MKKTLKSEVPRFTAIGWKLTGFITMTFLALCLVEEIFQAHTTANRENRWLDTFNVYVSFGGCALIYNEPDYYDDDDFEQESLEQLFEGLELKVSTVIKYLRRFNEDPRSMSRKELSEMNAFVEDLEYLCLEKNQLVSSRFRGTMRKFFYFLLRAFTLIWNVQYGLTGTQLRVLSFWGHGPWMSR